MTIRTFEEIPPLKLQMPPAVTMSNDQFFEFCRINRELRIERAATGEVIIMTPAGGLTGSRNADLTASLYLWAKQNGRGVVFDSSTGFILPNGATRSPDAAWVLRERLRSLTPEEKSKFLPLCPDFVVELRSQSDRLTELQQKMEEYMANGARLGWLLDPADSSVYVYRPHHDVTHLEDAESIAGDPVLPGFLLDLTPIWEPGF